MTSSAAGDVSRLRTAGGGASTSGRGALSDGECKVSALCASSAAATACGQHCDPSATAVG